MKLLSKVLAVSLMVCCQAAGSQDAANVSPVPSRHYACPMNPPAAGVVILSDTSGVNINPYLEELVSITDLHWYRLIPMEAHPPTLAKGWVQIGFKVLPDGKVKREDVVLEASSGDPALDHAAQKAIKKSKYPQLPREFKGPNLNLRFCFLYNMQSPEHSGADDKAP